MGAKLLRAERVKWEWTARSGFWIQKNPCDFCNTKNAIASQCQQPIKTRHALPYQKLTASKQQGIYGNIHGGCKKHRIKGIKHSASAEH